MFTKWFVQGRSDNKKPDYIATIANNVRIRYGGLTPRNWYSQLFEWSGAAIQWIQGTNNELLYIHWWQLKKLNLSTYAETVIWPITWLWSTARPSFVRYGIYTIILTWIDYPWVYDGSTLTQLTSTNISSSSNPDFGVQFAWFTAVHCTDKKNIIKFSRPVTLAAQTNSFMWDLTSWSESISYDTEVVWLESSMNYLWVFAKDKVEKFTKDSIATTWGIASLYSLPVAKWFEALNNDTIVSAWDFVLFVTKQRKVATIEYMQTNITDPKFTVISNITESWLDVQDWLDNLDDDQSKSFGIFDNNTNCVKWSFKSRNSSINDVWLVYDITNKTRYTDDNKLFSCACELNNNIYAGWVFSGDIFQDEVGKNDLTEWIDWKYQVKISLKNQYRKKWLWEYICWSVNYLAKIKRDVEVDDQLEFSDYITWSDYAESNLSLGIWWSMQWSNPIGGNIWILGLENNSFKKRITESRLMAKWVELVNTWSGNALDQDFVLDYLDISYKPLRTTETSDKF